MSTQNPTPSTESPPTIPKNWGEREGITLDLLRKFTKPGEIDAVNLGTQATLKLLPGLEYMSIANVPYYNTARPGKQWAPAPYDVRFFRFSGGYGCVAISPYGN